jgi:hypothetical protein
LAGTFVAMSDKRQERPLAKKRAAGPDGDREARLAAALKANLARRKAQARRRAAPESPSTTPDDRG